MLKKKVSEKVLLVHPVTSLDDAIDINAYVSTLKESRSKTILTRNRSETLAATYAFAAPASAKYLTQFIDADISWVNHVPSHMLSAFHSPSNNLPPNARRNIILTNNLSRPCPPTRHTLQSPNTLFTDLLPKTTPTTNKRSSQRIHHQNDSRKQCHAQIRCPLARSYFPTSFDEAKGRFQDWLL